MIKFKDLLAPSVFRTMELTPELKAWFIQPCKEAKYRRLHGQVLGRTITLIDPTGKAVYIRVLPTITYGAIPVDREDLVWASVWWNHKDGYVCSINNLPHRFLDKDKTTNHMSLESALRRARKAVAKKAPKPEGRWTPVVLPLHKDVYPTVRAIESDLEYERQYWEDVEREHAEEAERMFDGEPYELLEPAI